MTKQRDALYNSGEPVIWADQAIYDWNLERFEDGDEVTFTIQQYVQIHGTTEDVRQLLSDMLRELGEEV